MCGVGGIRYTGHAWTIINEITSFRLAASDKATSNRLGPIHFYWNYAVGMMEDGRGGDESVNLP